MLKRALAGLLFLFCVFGFAGAAGRFSAPMPKDKRIPHALSRLTFGARPGDAERVRAMGLKKWIDAQLHPSRIPENPVLEAKLKALDSLYMTSEQLVLNYPTPQIARLMASGQMAYPDDPDRRMMIRKLVARFQQAQEPAGPAQPAIADLLAPEQIRALRVGTTQQRMAAFEALPAQKQDEVIEAMPGVRLALFDAAPPPLRRRIELAGGPQQVVARDLLEGKLLRAVYGNRQLEEVLTDFWFNHFNIYLDKGADHYLVTEYERDVIRPRVLGRFKDLLDATAKSPAMLFYLDNWQSVAPSGRTAGPARRGLNENYARELLELHTLGVDGGYTQKDVTEVARCFTGWTISQPQRGGAFQFNPRAHDDGEKTVLGTRIPAGGGIADGQRVLDILAGHPSTARFISWKLAQRFVADDPPKPLVESMARTFLKTGGDLREIMKAMLESKEFWSVDAYRSKVKSPLEFVASAVRSVNGDVDYAVSLANQVGQLGQPLYRKQEPTGYSNSSAQWLNTAGLLARMNFAVQLGANRVPGVKMDPSGVAGLGGPAGVALGSPEFQKR